MGHRRLVVDRIELVTQKYLVGGGKSEVSAGVEARRMVAEELQMHERTLERYIAHKDAITSLADVDGT
jgi:hypothetical protein